jgi:hypothetical protein
MIYLLGVFNRNKFENKHYYRIILLPWYNHQNAGLTFKTKVTLIHWCENWWHWATGFLLSFIYFVLQCSKAGCEWAFTTHYKLKRHEESHQGKKSYMVSYNYMFSYSVLWPWSYGIYIYIYIYELGSWIT